MLYGSQSPSRRANVSEKIEISKLVALGHSALNMMFKYKFKITDVTSGSMDREDKSCSFFIVRRVDEALVASFSTYWNYFPFFQLF